MKTLKAGFLLFAAVILLTSLPAQAEEKTFFFAFDQGISSSSAAGEITQHPSGRTSARGLVAEADYYLFVPDLGIYWLHGVERCEYGYDVDANFEGTYSGKISIDFGEYGYFEGTYGGEFHPFLDHTEGFTGKVIGIAKADLNGAFRFAPGSTENWLIKITNIVLKSTAQASSGDQFGYIVRK